jgi:hypothetical protein
MNQDLRELLQAWPYDPEHNVRILDLGAGRQVLQVRLPLGIEQYELDGRPDGARPHQAESALEYYRQRLAAHGEPFVLEPSECAELFAEGTLYYFRYLHLFQVRDWDRVIRDTQRNLSLFDFVHEHARREEDRQQLEQWRPYLLRMHGIAQAMREWDAHHHDAALQIVQETTAQIHALPDLDGETFQIERQRSLEALRELENEIRQSRPRSALQQLEHDLQKAVEAQDFEQAAVLRDRIRALRAGGAP